MRVALGVRPSLTACERYADRRATSDRHGPDDGARDEYRAPLTGEPHGSAAFDAALKRLLAYDIFPPFLVRYRISTGATLAVGATIVQRIGIGIALEAAVRVVDVWDRTEGERRSAGFAYVTLQGHPERGIATFEVIADGAAVSVRLTAHSVPGSPITRLVRPIARVVQTAITKRALKRLASIA